MKSIEKLTEMISRYSKGKDDMDYLTDIYLLVDTIVRERFEAYRQQFESKPINAVIDKETVIEQINDIFRKF